MPSFFDEALLRLKSELKLQSDKEVAAWLGMTPTAFNARKARDAFPKEKLLAADGAALIDTAYVLTGTRSATHAALGSVNAATQLATRLGLGAEGAAAMQQAFQLPTDEQVLLTNYRKSTPEAKAKLLQQSVLLAAGIDQPPATAQASTPGIGKASVVQHNTGQGAIQIGNMGAPPPPKPKRKG
jgi:hypothetical protein